MQFVDGQGRNPNLIVRAVRYLGGSHAIPPMRGDTRWFEEMLAALIELACPRVAQTCAVGMSAMNDLSDSPTLPQSATA